jgi:signal transduction histidine kinase
VSEFEFQDALYPVEIDEEQIRQVFNGLINNAKEAMPDGGILRIKARNVELSERTGLLVKEGKYLLISTEDQGGGIPEINLRRIFDPYFTTKEMGADKGTGLGLAICHSIIKRHHGFITVASKVGVGSTFHVYIPAAED